MIAINTNMVMNRIYDFEISDEQIAEVFGPGHDLIDRLDPGSLTLAQLGRLAELVRLPPADLIDDGAGGGFEQRYADGVLAEFALAGAGGDVEGSVQMLGWDTFRRESATITLYHSPSWSMGVADALAAEERGTVYPGQHAAGGFRAYFADRTAPDPFDAAALMRLVSGAPPDALVTTIGYTSAAQARRLAAHALAVIEHPSDLDAPPFAESGFDTAVAVHPDLLYALDLTSAPASSLGEEV